MATAEASWEALGTNVVLRVTDPRALARAREAVVNEMQAIDRACSRFRADSEIRSVNESAGGRPVRVSDLLAQAIELAMRAAELTGGDVDPTVGRALVLSGYDRDWKEMERAQGHAFARDCALAWADPNTTDARDRAESAGADTNHTSGPPGAMTVTANPPGTRIAANPPRARIAAKRVGGWQSVRFDPGARTVRVPRGVMLDLGATAKAWVADRAASAASQAGECGALVSVGGDIAVSGQAPAGGWAVHVTDDHRSTPSAPGQTVKIESGGLATSSTAVRRWQYKGQAMHHIIDPRTGAPVRGTWRTVSVAAASCADANIATTAALVRAGAAPAWLAGQGMPARLVSASGRVYTVGDWPAQVDRVQVDRVQEPEADPLHDPASRVRAAHGSMWQARPAREPKR